MVNKYLLTSKETYRVDTVEDAEALNLEFKEDASENDYELKNFSYTKKQVKQRGEVIDEYVVCTATKVFNAEKEPLDGAFTISYLPPKTSEIEAYDLYADQEAF